MNFKLKMKIPWTSVLPATALLLLWHVPAPGQIVSTGPTNSITTIADTAAATLLVPYFEVNLSSPTGMNTIFALGNTGANSFFSSNGGVSFTQNHNGPTAILAHVTIWSDLGVPVYNFNIYLTGYDVETIDMRKVLTGTLPTTASAGQDPGDTLSPRGAKSQDINFNSCRFQLPYAPLTSTVVANLQAALTGKPSADQAGKCAGLNHNDNIARGYITVDTVNSCTLRNPGDTGYFAPGGGGDVTDQSFQLTGEVYYQDQDNQIFRGGNAVHIHASATDPLTSTSGNYTFYGRLDGFTAVDHRQPLPTTFAARYNSGANAGSLIVWRDPKVPQGYFTCGTNPAWYPLGQEGITAFDDQEHPQTVAVPSPFPAVTQIVPIGGASLPVSFPAGWLFLDLNTFVTPAGSVPPTDAAASQGWVDVIDGKYGVLHRAQQLDSAVSANHFFPSVP